MIISKNTSVAKDHKEQPLTPLIDQICASEAAQLPELLNKHLEWTSTTGDLYHWIKVLNYFDDILESIIKKYGLDQEPVRLREFAPEDAAVTTACLMFSKTLLDNCVNTSIYASADRVYQLVDCPLMDVKLAALEVALCLGKRYVNSSHVKDNAAPKDVRLKLLAIAKAFPPPVPAGFTKSSAGDSSHSSDHYGLIDTLNQSQKCPAKWKSLKFVYYCAKSGEKDKKAKKDKKKQTKDEGVLTFSMPEEQVRKLSLVQIFDKAAESIPANFLLEFSYVAINAKAFNTDHHEAIELRSKLLQMKCLAIAFVCCMCSADFVSYQLFESEPYTLGFLMELISPENFGLISDNIFYTASRTISIISLKPVWGSEVLRHLGGSVSHGLLYQVLRFINKKVQSDETSESLEKGYSSFMSILCNLAQYSTLATKLVAGGLLTELMSFLNIRSKHRWTCSIAVQIISILISDSVEMVTKFAENNGFQLLIETVNYEVNFALENPTYEGGNSDSPYQTIIPKQARYLKKLLNFVTSLIQSDAGDRLRNLFDSSILLSFNNVIDNPTTFGPSILSKVLYAVSEILHNEPTAFSILNEAQVVDKILGNYEKLFMPFEEVVTALLEVLGALALNKDGLNKIIDLKVMSIFFKAFSDIKMVKELLRNDIWPNLGCTMEELGRHNPTLAPIIIEEVIKLIQNFPVNANQVSEPVHLYASSNGSFYTSAQSEESLDEEGETAVHTWDGSDGRSIFDAAIQFLDGVLHDASSWSKDIVARVPYSSWEPMTKMRNAPYDFTATRGSSHVSHLLRFLTEIEETYVLKDVLQDLGSQLNTSEITSFCGASIQSAYFEAQPDGFSEANKVLQELNVLNNILCVLCDTYVSPLITNKMYEVLINFLGENETLVSKLVSLLGAAIRDDVHIRLLLPDEVLELTTPLRNFSSAATDSSTIHVKPPPYKDPQQTHTSPKFKNTLQLRFLMDSLRVKLDTILTCISVSCMHRRQDYFSDEWRRTAVINTKNLVVSLYNLFAKRSDLTREASLNFEYHMLKTISAVVTTKDRGRDVLSTSTLSFFFVTTDLAKDIITCACDCYEGLLEIPHEELSKYKDQKFVHRALASIEIKNFEMCLWLFSRMTLSSNVIRLPYTSFFYNKAYCEFDNLVVDGILTLAGAEALEHIIWDVSQDSSDDDLAVFKYLPRTISDHFVTIVRQVWSIEPIDYYYPLDADRMSPAHGEILFLHEKLDISRDKAKELLHAAKSIHQIPELPLEVLDADLKSKWPHFLESLNSHNLDQEFNYPPVKHGRLQEVQKELKDQTEKVFSDTLLKMATKTGWLQNNFAQTVKSIGLDGSITENILQEIVKYSANKSETNLEYLKNLYPLLEEFICHDPFVIRTKLHDTHQATFLKTVDLFLSELENHPELVDSDYFAAGLSLMRPILSQTPPVVLNGVKPYFPDLTVSDLMRRRIASAILKLEPKSNIKTSTVLSRYMYLLNIEGTFKEDVSKSPLLRSVASRMNHFMETEGKEEYKALQNAVILVFRSAFENKSIVENVFSSEITKQFKRHSGRKREFRHFIDESRYLIGRDPNLFLEVASNMIRLDNYDGKSTFSKKVFLLEPENQTQDSSNEDVEMADSEPEAPASPSGIVNILLQQLMAVSKEDWVSSPPKDEKEEEQKKDKRSRLSEFEELSSNRKFGYMYFLLQSICEIVGAYKEAKLEFITFSKKGTQEDRNKPRLTSLNFFIHQLIHSHSLARIDETESKRREAISSLAKLTLLSLVSTTIIKNDAEPDPRKEDPDMAIVRKLMMDIISKILKETSVDSSSVPKTYSKLLDFFDLCSCLLSSKYRELCFPLLNVNATKFDQFYLASAFIDAQLPNQVSLVLANLDLNFPEVSRVSNAGLKCLSSLAKTKLAHADLFENANSGDKEEEDLEDLEERDDTPDLFRNSTLGMYDLEMEDMSVTDISGDSESFDETSDSELESEDDIEEIDDDEMGEYEHSEGDIEIIEDLDIQSGEDSEYESDPEEFHGFDDDSEYEGELDEEEMDYEGESEEEDYYDEAELDGWLDAFADSDENDGDTAEPSRFAERFSEADRGEVRIASDSHSESSFASDSDVEGSGERPATVMSSQPITSFLDAIRPFTQSIVTTNPSGILGGRIHIAGRGADYQMDAALQALLNEGAPKNTSENMLIKSTTERWGNAFMYFFKPFESKISEVARLQLTEKISEASLELFKKKAEEKEKARKERLERIKKRQEEERKRREEEAQQIGANESSNNNQSGEPVMLWIGNREVDISGTDIDPEFFEALPEDMREEVFTQHVRERRAHANSFGSSSREIDPDFLGALPDQIRDDILQQESIARRMSGGSVGFFGAEDSENDFFDEFNDDEFDFTMNDEAGDEQEEPEVEKPKPKSQTFSVPLIDRTGVAGVVKLLFLPRTFKQREQIYKTLTQVTKNKQSRADVLSMLVAILHDGLTSQKALEKMFNQLSAKITPKTPGKPSGSFPIGATPLVIGIQVIEALLYLLERNNACRLFLLTEHENSYLINQHNKRARLKKASAYEDSYPINLLIRILEIPSLSEENIFMDLLANVLNLSTRPLLILRDSKKPTPPGLGTNFVPGKNLRLVIKILTSNDCENATFRSTISAMHHLSLLKGSQDVLTSELSDTASLLGGHITRDLQNLVVELQSEPKADVYESRIVSKFISPSSDQSKLLRILTALDYMFESKQKDSEKAESSQLDKLTVLYEKLELGSLWKELSNCLRVLEQNSNLTHFATSLLPSIEALMVVCKHSKVRELQIKDVMKYEARKIDYTKEPIENLFFTFTDEHKKILNSMVRSNPNLVNGPFSMLVRNSKVLEFDNKRNYFNSQLHTNKERGPKMPVTVRRDQVFLDSYRSLFFKSVEEFKKAHLEITFKGEAGLDAGGVSREWYQVLSRQMFNPDYALFTPVESHENTYHPNRTSYINPEHLSFFKFIGRIIGKAIYDGGFLDCHFSRAVYKNILDRPVSLKDMENLDLEYFKSLIWMLENDITDIITEDFSVETDDYGEHKIIDLVPNGRNIPVTQENKQEYVQLVTEYRLQTSVKEQMSNFIMGFHEVIPKDLVAIFDEQELELLISGLPDIDVQDWQNNTTYNNYSASSEQIRWFWRAVKSFDNEERAKLLQFSTGTSKVPLNGFKGLKGANGVCKFSIHRDYGDKDRLPSSHTCFNQINLPAYETYETLRGSLLLAVSEGHEGFQLA